ncbi:HAD family phosphatase [Streptosporangium sp. NBC_01639]|uniref:HAD family hydrolase n=1 Tax=Streptosporangium sp. NBC_01639 TaxID=2975948 RepID=UPI003864A7B2|nr:HAD family phosphatase [Streptosporangium sp. NBC_01639]
MIVTIRAVVFDVGGVLEITADLGVAEQWEEHLSLPAGELNNRMFDVWMAGSVGTITENEVHQAIADRLGLADQHVEAFMAAIWRQYLGVPNTELIEYVRELRSRCRTAILSNSFVGAREQEQTAYGFEDLVEQIIYSHEVGMSKPDPRIYALTCARLGVRPEEMVFLDDVDGFVAGARDAGIHAIHYQNNTQAIDEIEKLLAVS